MKISSLADAEKILQEFVPKVSTYTGDNMTLDRMFPLLVSLDNPQNKLKVIHVAGTSGKTSTSYYIASQLRESGKKVGLTVSPHVDRITERIQIDGKPVSDEKFCHDLGVFLDLISGKSANLSYFELLIAFVYWVFERESVDYAVIETGMGGLLDGTNVATNTDKICVITDIGFDHMHILGNTLSEIAAQKAGIIQKKNRVFMYRQSDEVMMRIEERVASQNSSLQYFTYSNLLNTYGKNVDLLPDFQKRNWLLAEQVVRAVAGRDAFQYKQIKHPENIIVPGRMDTRILSDSSILIMDGAHNAQKVCTFVSSFKAVYPNRKATIMLALKKGKEYREVIDSLLPIAGSFILTTFDTTQDLPATSQNPEKIADYCSDLDVFSEVVADNREALVTLLNKKSDIKLIVGSFYLLGQVRNFL
jgi:dihydrofolate synthase / folylpolyglutamate synthase